MNAFYYPSNLARAATFAIVAWACGGCRSVPPPAPQPTPVGQVEVGGAVANPQKIDIPVEGLSLAQALIHAGGPREPTPGAGTGLLLVGLQRGKGALGDVHYFALDLVQHDLAGDIPLKTGDVIRVVDLNQTNVAASRALQLFPQREGASIVINGLVAKPGQYAITKLAQPGKTGAKRLDQLFDASTAAGRAANSAEANVVAIVRRRPSGIGNETYVLPFLNLAAFDAEGQPRPETPAPEAPAPGSPEQPGAPSVPPSETDDVAVTPSEGSSRPQRPAVGGGAVSLADVVLQAPLVPGDVVTLTRIEGIPIVLGGLVNSVVREKAARDVRVCERLCAAKPDDDTLVARLDAAKARLRRVAQ